MNQKTHIPRRQFLEMSTITASALAAGGGLARGAAGNSPVRLGLVGCGSRGSWIGKLFVEHGGYQIAACADYFEDRANKVGDELQVPAGKRFTGLSGYRRLYESGAVDAVAIETPPYFHPAQVAEAIDAGLHAYVAKPIAVDVPGCQSIAESGRKATEKKLCLVVDFQARVDPFMIETMDKVAGGAIGSTAFGEAMYHAGDPFGKREGVEELAADPRDPAKRLRVFGLDKVLSGDIVVEQSIHALDMLSWAMGRPPVDATGTGGRAVRQVGDCFDNFTAVLRYGDGIGVTFSHCQIPGYGTAPSGIRVRLYGTVGVLEAQYGGESLIRGQNRFRGGESGAIFKEGAQANIKTFHESIVGGKFDNPTVPPSVQSNLHSLLVRKAAYTGETVRWEDLIKDTEVLDPKLDGLKD